VPAALPPGAAAAYYIPAAGAGGFGGSPPAGPSPPAHPPERPYTLPLLHSSSVRDPEYGGYSPFADYPAGMAVTARQGFVRKVSCSCLAAREPTGWHYRARRQ
jgi:hypothetical protein